MSRLPPGAEKALDPIDLDRLAVDFDYRRRVIRRLRREAGTSETAPTALSETDRAGATDTRPRED